MPTRPDSILDEILAYVEFSDADRARLVELHARIAPQLPDIATRFYARVHAIAGTAALVSGPEQVSRLRAALVDWMASGLVGPYDDRFYAKRSRIGHRHVEIGLPQHYMFTAMSVIRGEYDDRIAALYPPGEARAAARSVNKLMDVELALMLRNYQADSEAKLVSRERHMQADRVTAMQTLTAGLAHEVRNPLNSAKLQLELLERRVRREGGDPKLAEPIELTRAEIERLTRLLNEFLAFARPSELALGNHDVVALAREVVAGEGALAAQRGASIEMGPHEPVIAHIDATKLRQILHNLVRNAVEAVTAGGRITVTVRGDDANLYLRVEDDGPGIPDAIRGRIYEPFFSTKERGAGLGMSIVHSMVTLHGGTIDVGKGPRGTCFDVAMPRGA